MFDLSNLGTQTTRTAKCKWPKFRENLNGHESSSSKVVGIAILLACEEVRKRRRRRKSGTEFFLPFSLKLKPSSSSSSSKSSSSSSSSSRAEEEHFKIGWECLMFIQKENDRSKSHKTSAHFRPCGNSRPSLIHLGEIDFEFWISKAEDGDLVIKD